MSAVDSVATGWLPTCAKLRAYNKCSLGSSRRERTLRRIDLQFGAVGSQQGNTQQEREAQRMTLAIDPKQPSAQRSRIEEMHENCKSYVYFIFSQPFSGWVLVLIEERSDLTHSLTLTLLTRINQPTKQPNNQPINQSTKQPNNQTTNQSTSQPINQSTTFWPL